MKFYGIVALLLVAALAAVSANAAPDRQDDTALIQYALARPGVQPYLGFIAKRIIGVGLYLIGRVVSKIGESLVGTSLNRFQLVNQHNGGKIMNLHQIATNVLNSTAASREEELASKLVAATFDEVASEKLAGDQLRTRLAERLREVSARVIQADERRGAVKVDTELEKQIVGRILKKIIKKA